MQCPGQPGARSQPLHADCSIQTDRRNSLVPSHTRTILVHFHCAIGFSTDPAPRGAPAPDGFQEGQGEQPLTSSPVGRSAISTAATCGSPRMPHCQQPRCIPSRAKPGGSSLLGQHRSWWPWVKPLQLCHLVFFTTSSGEGPVSTGGWLAGAQDLEKLPRQLSRIPGSRLLISTAFLCFQDLCWHLGCGLCFL